MIIIGFNRWKYLVFFHVLILFFVPFSGKGCIWPQDKKYFKSVYPFHLLLRNLLPLEKAKMLYRWLWQRQLEISFCLRKMGSSAPHCGGSGIAFLTLWHQDWNNIVGGAKTNQARWKGHWCDITTISPASQFFLSGIPDFRFSQCTLKRALLRKVQAQHLKKWKKKENAQSTMTQYLHMALKRQQ